MNKGGGADNNGRQDVEQPLASALAPEGLMDAEPSEAPTECGEDDECKTGSHEFIPVGKEYMKGCLSIGIGGKQRPIT